jgi:hypothetical protein
MSRQLVYVYRRFEIPKEKRYVDFVCVRKSSCFSQLRNPNGLQFPIVRNSRRYDVHGISLARTIYRITLTPKRFSVKIKKQVRCGHTDGRRNLRVIFLHTRYHTGRTSSHVAAVTKTNVR